MTKFVIKQLQQDDDLSVAALSTCRWIMRSHRSSSLDEEDLLA